MFLPDFCSLSVNPLGIQNFFRMCIGFIVSSQHHWYEITHCSPIQIWYEYDTSRCNMSAHDTIRCELIWARIFVCSSAGVTHTRRVHISCFMHAAHFSYLQLSFLFASGLLEYRVWISIHICWSYLQKQIITLWIILPLSMCNRFHGRLAVGKIHGNLIGFLS